LRPEQIIVLHFEPVSPDPQLAMLPV
jgi:hypothetical protein